MKCELNRSISAKDIEKVSENSKSKPKRQQFDSDDEEQKKPQKHPKEEEKEKGLSKK